jgi:hypothetical protein
MQESAVSSFGRLLQDIGDEAAQYFQRASQDLAEENLGWDLRRDPDHCWRRLAREARSLVRDLSNRLARCSSEIAASFDTAPLVSGEDIHDLRKSTKAMLSALKLRKYQFHEVEVICDEDRVLGVQGARQTENECLLPLEAASVFRAHISKLRDIVLLIEASSGLDVPKQNASGISQINQIRYGTAFIMMWMDGARPELIDVVDAVKEIFNLFGIMAVRADDIEHEGQISQRVLKEIRTSEYLFADLTGSRPNVYYEVGYAHALRRSVILYRRAGTELHFDLGGYNCPSYANMRDLKEKLRKRLELMTNRVLKDGV